MVMSLGRVIPLIGLTLLGAVVIASGYRAFEAMETLPGYLIEADAMRITNCDPPHDDRVRTTCERLHCWRALIEDGTLPSDFRVEPGEARRDTPDGPIVHVAPLALETADRAGPAYVRCIMLGYEVERVEVLDRAGGEALERTGDLWDPAAGVDAPSR
jgi:hypothetical protein